jgi:multiple sugar transport system permease protein
MIQILAGLQTISEDIVEAAIIDGANKPQVFLHVILPGMRATLIVTLILDTVWWFKHVTMIWLLTQGGPGTITNTISVDIYKRAFEYFNFGSSSAIAVIVFLICIAINMGYRRLLRDE